MALSDEFYCLDDFEVKASEMLPQNVFQWVQRGTQNEETIDENRKAFAKYKIRPRVMRNVSERTMKTSLLGHEISMPICAAPTAFHTVMHNDGEAGTAKVISASQTVMTISILSTLSTADIMKTVPSLICFQQLHITNPKSMTLDIVRTAEHNNVKGIVVTADMPILGNKLHMKRHKISFGHVRIGNSTLDEYRKHGHNYFNATQSWDDISWLKSITKLPVIIKGVQTSEDAIEALNHGADAIWVSNHGGRQLDCVRATIDVLSEVVEAVDGRCEVYVDGGFRTGLDVFKALALGARAVFIGRSVMYGLACGGGNGVEKVFDLLRSELDNTMALAGCCSVSEINRSYVTNVLKSTL